MPISKPDFNLIFASQAPSQDLPAAFNNYARGWDEARKNNGKPTIKQFNYLIQRLDIKALWMIQNGATLPFDETVDYAEGAFTVKDGSLQQFAGGVWKKPTQTADQIFDESGSSQQEINNLFSSQWVNILSVYGGVNDFGVAMELAYTKAVSLSLNTILIPAGRYESITTANLSLVADLNIEFSQGVFIDVKNQIDVFDVVQDKYMLTINGNNVEIKPKWTEHNPLLKTAAFRLNSKTFSRSLEMQNTQVLLGNKDYDTGFTHAVHAIGLNYSLLSGCLFQAQQPFFCESNPNSHRSMGSNLVDCFLQSSESSVVLKNNGVLGCEGWSFKGGEYLSHTDGITVIDNTEYPTYSPPLLHVIGVHIAARRFFNLSGISRVIISACDLQAEITTDMSYKALIELEGVQVFSICGGTVISQTGATTGASEPADSKPVMHIRNSPRGRVGAHIEIGNIQPWLYQNAPMVTFDSNINFAGRVKISRVTQGEFVGPICANGFSHLVTISDDTVIGNNSLVSGFAEGSCTFNAATGVLRLAKPPSIGEFYLASSSVVPANSTVNRIEFVGHIGKQVRIRFESQNILLKHGANLFAPANTDTLVTKAGIVVVQSFNSEWGQVVAVPEGSVLMQNTVPTATSSAGVHGQKVYNSGFIYEYLAGVGWLKITASTF